MADLGFAAGMLTGHRYQAVLGGKPVSASPMLTAMAGGVGAQIGKVKSVNYEAATVDVASGSGTTTYFVLKSKSSKQVAGSIDMPNVGDIGIVMCINGDAKSGVWIGSINTIETSLNVESDKTLFPTISSLIHAVFKKHETGSYWLLNKLGNLTALIIRKAAQESDPAKKHVTISIGNDGKVTLTHYRGDDKKGAEFSLSESGAFSFDVLKEDGSTVVHSFQGSAASGSETFKYENKTGGSSIEAKPDGSIDIIDGVGGKMTLTISDKSANFISSLGGSIKVTDKVLAKSGASSLELNAAIATLKGSTVSLEGGIIKLGTSGFLPFVTNSFLALFYNVVIPLLKTHQHPVIGTSPSGPVTGTATASSELAVPDVKICPPVPPNVTAQVTGG